MMTNLLGVGGWIRSDGEPLDGTECKICAVHPRTAGQPTVLTVCVPADQENHGRLIDLTVDCIEIDLVTLPFNVPEESEYLAPETERDNGPSQPEIEMAPRAADQAAAI